MKKRRVLIVAPLFLPLLGGMEEQCYMLARSFIGLGYEVDILTEQTRLVFPKMEVMDGINVYRLSYIKNRNIWNFLKMFLEIMMFLNKRSKTYEFGIVRTLTFHCMAISLMKVFGLKLRTLVTAEAGGKCDDIVALKRSKLWTLYFLLVNKHNYLNSLCEDNTCHYRDLGFDMKKVTKIYNGIDVTGYKRSKYPTKVSSFVFLGRLVRAKGIFELVKAFALVMREKPDVKLYIGGDGPDKSLLLEKIKPYEKNIVYSGYIKRDERDNFYKGSDCLILPSYSESFSLVVYEAVVKKRYVIATDVADLKKVLGNNILFCRKRDYKDLAKKIIFLCDNCRSKKTDYDSTVKQMNIKTIAQKYVSLFGGGSR